MIRIIAIIFYVLATMALLKSVSELFTGKAAETGMVVEYSGLLFAAIVAGLVSWYVDKRYCSGPKLLFDERDSNQRSFDNQN